MTHTIRFAFPILLALALLPACMRPMSAQPATYGGAAGGGSIEDQQLQGFIDSSGDPTNHSRAESEAFIAQHTEGYTPEGVGSRGSLERVEPMRIQVERGKCYAVVFRLEDGARYSRFAKAGLTFDFDRLGSDHSISGGPGVHGPGGVGSAGCPFEDATYEFRVGLLFAGNPPRPENQVGTGEYTIELVSKPISEEQLAALRADQQRQIEEQQAFAAQRDAERLQGAQRACNTCNARYEGCRGAGGSPGYCNEQFRSCRFQQGGVDAVELCPHPPSH